MTDRPTMTIEELKNQASGLSATVTAAGKKYHYRVVSGEEVVHTRTSARQYAYVVVAAQTLAAVVKWYDRSKRLGVGEAKLLTEWKRELSETGNRSFSDGKLAFSFSSSPRATCPDPSFEALRAIPINPDQH